MFLFSLGTALGEDAFGTFPFLILFRDQAEFCPDFLGLTCIHDARVAQAGWRRDPEQICR